MKKLIFIFAVLAISCKKESKCHTCLIKKYNAQYKEYYSTGKVEDFCGTAKELKQYQDHKLSQNLKLECAN